MYLLFCGPLSIIETVIKIAVVVVIVIVIMFILSSSFGGLSYLLYSHHMTMLYLFSFGLL